MSTEVFTIRFDKKLLVAREIMDWACVRHVPVVDDEDRLVGIISHRDLLRASMSSLDRDVPEVERRLLHLGTIPIKRVMQTDVATIGPNAPVQEAARRMRAGRFGCLPVVEHDRVIGIVTEHDLLRIVERIHGRDAARR